VRIPRIFCNAPLASGQQVLLDEQASRHLQRVLRLKHGDPIVLFDGSGRDFEARIGRGQKPALTAQVGDVLRQETPPTLRIHLAIGVSRGERMDFALQKAVELGVWEIQPLFTERSVVRLSGERLASRQGHWQGVVQHACGQSGRSLIPALQNARPFSDWLSAFNGRGILLDHRAKSGLGAIDHPGTSVTLLVGPEGGLSITEREAAGSKQFQAVRLGPRILRTETAPLAAISALQTLWGDFNGSI